MLLPFSRTLAAFVCFVCLASTAATGAESAAVGAGETNAQTVRLGQRASFGSVSMKPVRVVSDSRCPVGAQCVWQGTVQILVETGQGKSRRRLVMRMDEAVQLKSTLWVTLGLICPVPRLGSKIASDRYRFTFLPGTTSHPRPADAVCPRNEE